MERVPYTYATIRRARHERLLLSLRWRQLMSWLNRTKAIAFITWRILIIMLLGVVIVLWIHSFICTDEIRFRWQTKSRASLLYIASMPGSLGILFDSSQLSSRSPRFTIDYNRHPKHFGALYSVPQNTSSPWNALGFAFVHESLSITDLIGVNAPHWFIAMIFASSAFFVLRHHRRSPTDLPKCSDCGYSLVGNKSGVCPECGKACKVTDLVPKS
jgi:hypothetical protein